MQTGLRRTLSPRRLRRRARSAAEGPFARLVRHFLHKLVRASEIDLGIGGLLAVLAAPGAFTAMLMLDKYSAFLNWYRGHLRDDLYVTSIPDKYLFLAVAMAVTGIVTVLKWDRILPDSQDYLNLAPLPVSHRRILLANATAILAAVLVVAVDVSAVPTFLFPMFVTAAGRSTFMEFLRFAGAHILCVILASIFSICSVFALLGTLAAVLPREAFRAVSSWMRGLMLLALIALLLTGFAGPNLFRYLQRYPDSPARYLPSLWYLALYQAIQHRSTPLVAKLAGYAWTGLAAVVSLMAATYTLSYRRRFAGVLEGRNRPSGQRTIRAVLALLDAFAPRAAGFRRAGHRFVVRALLRSETHRLTLAVAIGLGWMAAFQSSDGASLAAAYLLILGLRIAFELPASTPANWVFQVVLDPRHNESPGVARRVMLSFLAPLVLAPCFAVAWRQSGPAAAAVHTAYVLALSLVLMEVLLAGYRKLPLTCPMPGFRENFFALCLVQLLGFVLFTRAGASIEGWAWRQPWCFAFVPLAMAAAWHWNRRRLAEAREAGELEEGLTFENAVVTTVERLDLSDAK
jgi:hypothetical protein